MSLTLHEYQRTAARFLQARGRAALFLDMGLGKTAVTLTALSPDHLPALVVAPKRVAENVWGTEARLWRPDLHLEVAAGSPAARGRAITSGADVVVIGRDNMADVLPHAHVFRTLVLDELSGFKTRNTLRWKAAARLAWGGPDKRNYLGHARLDVADPIPHVWGLTGTPSPNGLHDLWAQVYLLDQGARLGRTVTAYRERFFTPGWQMPSGVVTSWNPRPGAQEAVQELLDDVCLSMGTMGRVDVPETTLNVVPVPLPPKAQRAYDDMLRDFVADLDILGTFTAKNAAVKSNRLAQITAGALYPDKDDPAVDPDGPATVLHTEKAKTVREIVEGTGSPVLVFYRYRFERDMLLAELGELAHTTDTPAFAKRWNAGQLPVLLAHPASAGHGLNLQHGGHTAVWTSPTWSLEEWQQANKRLARQGQKHPVVIHVLNVPRSVDGAILRALTEKSTIQQTLLDHLESPV